MNDTKFSQRMRTDWDARNQKRGIRAIVPIRSCNEFWDTGRESVDKLLHVLRITRRFLPNMRVLDIGSGLGRMEYWLVPYVFHVCGIDVSPRMVGDARALASLDRDILATRMSFSPFDGVTIPLGLLGRGRFDLVFSWITIQHLPDVAVLEGWLKSLPPVLEEDAVVVLQYKTAPRRRLHGYSTHKGIRLRPCDWPDLAGRFGFGVIFDWCFPDDKEFRAVVMEQTNGTSQTQ